MRRIYATLTFILAALTAVTLVAGLAIGRKGKMEKQVEAESNKVNG